MLSASMPHCDCCGLIIDAQMGEDCPRCGYPISPTKEEHFLISSLRDLKRVAAHGGADTTVTQLIHRYQKRLQSVRQFRVQSVLASPGEDSQQKVQPSVAAPAVLQLPPLPTTPVVPVQPEVSHVPTLPTTPPMAALSSVSGERQPRPRVFSLETIFSDQAINVFASVGAFLILIGALSFIIVNNPDVQLSFIVLLAIHCIFGLTGLITYRFKNFRLIAGVYTALFALLVPLVCFTGYELVLAQNVHISSPTVVAMAAVYAAIVYGALAIYQKFHPFGYLSVASLVVADLATAQAFNLAIWWYPVALMILAFPSLACLPRGRTQAGPLQGDWTILQGPIYALMCASVIACGLGIVYTTLYSLEPFNQQLLEVRFALVVMTFLFLCWYCLFVWYTRRPNWVPAVPYLFLAFVLACCYALELRQVGYVLSLTGVALFYHGLNRFARRLLILFDTLAQHVEALSLVLVGGVTLIAAPLLPLQILVKAYAQTAAIPVQGDTLIAWIAIAVGLMLTLSVMLYHTGMHKTPEASQSAWCWLLLLSGFLLNWLVGMMALWLSVEPVWCFLVLTLIFVASAVAARRLMSAAWANPLDILALCASVQTIALSLRLGTDSTGALYLFFAALSYVVLLYQRRGRWLFLSVVFATFALVPLVVRPRVLLTISICLPFMAVVIRRFVTDRWNVSAIISGTRPQVRLLWEWPLLTIGLLYAIVFSLIDLLAPVSTLSTWLGIGFPVALEIAILSFTWYTAAFIAREKSWLLVSIGFALGALLLPSNSFWILVWLAPVFALLALSIGRVAGRDWAAPFYIVAVLAAVMMGRAGYSQGQIPAATWTLLIFASLLYLVGALERDSGFRHLLLWIAPCFAFWSVYISTQSGDFYRAPIVALTCALLGMLTLKIKPQSPTVASWLSGRVRNEYVLPLYGLALFSAILTGLPITATWNSTVPFFAAVPAALLFYALLGYVVLLVERRPSWLWLVAGFASWSVLRLALLPSCGSACELQIQSTAYAFMGIALCTGGLGLLTGHFIKQGIASTGIRAKVTWSWPWYATLLVAMLTANIWSNALGSVLFSNLTFTLLDTFIVLTLLIMVVERAPEVLVVPMTLSAWAISRTDWTLWQHMAAYSLLCVLTFGTQYIWKILPSATNVLSPRLLSSGLGLGGQALVVVTVMLLGGLVAGTMAHTGAALLCVLALLLFWHGQLQTETTVRHWCGYSMGLLLSLAVSWEMLALGQTRLDWLSIAPATYLIILAPFLIRDEALPHRYYVGQVCSLVGAALLTFPTLWLSFGEDNLAPTVFLASEALALLLLGIVTRMRVFVLAGTALIVVSAIHALFLPALGISRFLALSLVGVFLLALATVLTLVRHRLHSLWAQTK